MFPGCLQYPSCCVYCSRQIPRDLLEWDHVVPTSRGGSGERHNKVITCGTCNRLKGVMLPFAEWVPPSPLPGLDKYVLPMLIGVPLLYNASRQHRPCPDCGTIVSGTYMKAPRVVPGEDLCRCHRLPPQPIRAVVVDGEMATLRVKCESCGGGIHFLSAPGRRQPRYCSERCRRSAIASA